MAKVYHMERELAIADLGLSLEDLRGQPLELFAREGARILPHGGPGGGGDRVPETKLV